MTPPRHDTLTPRHQNSRVTQSRGVVVSWRLGVGLLLSVFVFFTQAAAVIATPADSGEIEFTFVNDLDSTKQQAVIYAPAKCRGKESPLLVVAHYWKGDRFTAKRIGYYEECEKRGWLLVCPQLHGHRTGWETPVGALESQHDVLGAIAWARANFKVDSTRIFMVGRSMGGQLAQVMAAKYPDLFAAAVAGQGISDLHSWIVYAPQFKERTELECGVFSADTRFEYARRSSVNYGPNLTGIPLILWHGTADELVPPGQTIRLCDSINRYTPYVQMVNWLVGNPHVGVNYPPQWECDQLQYHRNTGEGIGVRFFKDLKLVTDEDKRFYWLRLTRSVQGSFGRITAALRHDSLVINTSNLSRVIIDLARMPQNLQPIAWSATTDCPLEIGIARGDSILLWLSPVKVRGSGKIDLR